MSFNAFLLQSIAVELNKTIRGARVEKIHQPENATLTLELRLPGRHLSLLLSAHPVLARFYLTEYKFTNPIVPSSFCMLLRKHLEKYRLDTITSVTFERIVRLDFSREEDYGRSREKKSLILEIMGKHSNLILVDESDVIIDAYYRIDESKSRVRQVLPKLAYTLPPEQKKISPDKLTVKQLAWFLEVADPSNLAKALVKNIKALSPELAEQIIRVVYNPKENPDAILNILQQLQQKASGGLLVPTIQNNELSFYPLAEGSVNQVVDQFYTGIYLNEKTAHIKRSLTTSLNAQIERVDKKLDLRNDAHQQALLADDLRKKGDLLTASLYLLQRGEYLAKIPDYYTEGQPLIEIELNPRLGPNENAQSYYKRYNKARSALKSLDKLLTETKTELDYLKEVRGLIEAAKDLDDLDSLTDELIKEGYIKEKITKQVTRSKDQKTVIKPRCFLTSSGKEIVVGRNNKQNDAIRRQNSGDFVWFHAQKIPGSHVVLKDNNPIDNDLLLAATLAAIFSKGSTDSYVAVDSARLKHVRKPSGAKPGFVLYDNERTFIISPDESIFTQLKVIE